MSRCKCSNPKTFKRKKMRLRPDGWKRCYRCGVEVMGLTLRAKLGRERMEREGWSELSSSVPLVASPVCEPIPRRLPVTWRSVEVA